MTTAPRETYFSRRVFAARMDMLPETAVFVEGFCARCGIGHDNAARITLVVEELFTNTVMHGYRSESDNPIRISLDIENGKVVLIYEDAAPAYDPRASIADAGAANLDATIGSRQVGGLGLRLVALLSDTTRYDHVGGFNRLTVMFP